MRAEERSVHCGLRFDGVVRHKCLGGTRRCGLCLYLLLVQQDEENFSGWITGIDTGPFRNKG